MTKPILLACLLAAATARARDDAKPDAIIAETTETLRTRPDDVASLLARAAAWALKGEHDRAIADASEAIRLDPRSIDAYSLRGGVWIVKKEFGRAVADFDEAIRLGPGVGLYRSPAGSPGTSAGITTGRSLTSPR